MKRIIAILLAALMLLAMGAAYAEEEKLTDTSEVDLVKIYQLINKGTSNPAETFSFTLEKVGVSKTSFYTKDTMPMPETSYSIDFAKGEATVAGAEETDKITIPTYDHVGVFTYKITEIVPDPATAGVSYDTTPIYMVVTASNDPDNAGKFIRTVALFYGEPEGNNKTDNITNKFYASGDEEGDGGLQVTKKVTGNMGELDRYFPIVVNLKAPTGPVTVEGVTFTGTVVHWDEITINNKEIAASGVYGADATEAFTQPTSVKEGDNTFYLKDGETLKLGNLPYGVTYTVSEEQPDKGTDNEYDEAKITYSDDGKMIDSKEADTVEVLNNREMEIITGIILQSLPYILIVALVAAGVVIMMVRRRKSEDD